MGGSSQQTRNDPIHGHIPIDDVFRVMMGLRSIRQLKYKSQLGMVVEIFDAAEHSRYVHVRGTAWVADRMGAAVGLSQNERRYLRAAAWLHDIGHYPFSHAGERALPDNFQHENVFSYVFAGRDFGSINATEILGGLEKLGLDPKRVSDILQGRDVLSQFISNSIVDADKLDYISRDHHSAKLGNIDINYIINQLTFRTSRRGGKKLGIRNGASTNLKDLINAYSISRNRMYTLPKVHAGETQLVEAMRHHPPFAVLREGTDEEKYAVCSSIHAMREEDFIDELAESEHPLTAELGGLLSGSALNWYKMVARRGNASHIGSLTLLVERENEVRAACLEEGFLYSCSPAKKALKKNSEEVPYLPVWSGRKEESFLEREKAAREDYLDVSHNAAMIFAREETSTTRKRADQIFRKYEKS